MAYRQAERRAAVVAVLVLVGLLISLEAHSAPLLVTNFAGIAQTPYNPADPIIAAGPSNLVVLVNSTIAVYTKSGGNVGSSTLASFFSPVSPPGVPYDPKVVYDAKAGHWVMLALANGNPRTSSYLIAVSTNSSPINWWIWNLDAGLDQNTASGLIAYGPGLGYDSDEAVYITSSQFDTHNNFQYSKLRIIPKSLVYSGGAVGSANWRDFWNQTNANGSIVFGWRPAQAQSTIAGNYLVNTQPGGSNYITLWRVTNPLSTNGPTLTRQATLTLQPYSTPPDASQQGGTAVLNTGDCSVQEAQYQNGKLVTAFTEGYNWGGGSVSAVRTLVLDAASSTVNVDRRFGVDKLWHYYPAIVRDQAGNMAMVFNRSGTNEYAGAYYSVWLSGETNWEASSALKAGQAYYGSGVNLWGNYSGAALDPTEAGRVWLYSEYAVSSSQWGTWIGEVPLLGPPPAPTNSVGATNCASAPFPASNPPLTVALVTNSDYPAGTLTVDWYDASVGGNLAASNTASFTPTNNAAAGPNTAALYTYWAQARVLSNGLTSTNRTPATLRINPRPTAAVSGNTNICGGASATIRATLTGIGPWTIRWASNGVAVATNTAAANSATLSVTPASTSTYTIAALTDSVCSALTNDLTGSATVTVLVVANDQCAGASFLPAEASLTESTTCATSQGDPASVCGFSVGKGVWFYFVAPMSGIATISTCGSDFNTVLQVYTGTCGSLAVVGCNSGNDSACFPNQAQVQFNVSAGTSYLIFAAGVGGASGNLHISTHVCQPPHFVGIFTNSITLTSSGILVSVTVMSPGTPPYDVSWSYGPSLFADIHDSPDFSFLIPLDQVADYLSDTNFGTISAVIASGCGAGSAGGVGGFSSPCVVCLSRGVPVSSSTVVDTAGSGSALTNSCGTISSSAKWFQMAAADSGNADVSVFQSTGTNCYVSVFRGPRTNLVAVACNRTITNGATRLQFAATTNQPYWLIITNGGTLTNLTYGFVPQIAGSLINPNHQFQLQSGVGPALTYTFQASTGFVAQAAWTNLYTAAFPTNGATYIDSKASNFSRRFYRIAPGP